MRQSLLSLSLLLVALAAAAPAQDRAKRWDIMTSHEIGADRFKAKFPDFDGKGVVIAVLDTGVDMGVEGLKVLPTGKPKVVDVRDFSTEGDLYWEEGHINPGEKGEKIVDNKGRGLTHFRKAVEGADPARFYLAFIEEKSFRDADVKDLNGDGDSKDVFGVLIFTVKDDEGKMRYVAAVDVNGDGRLDDGVRVSDYWRNQETFCMAGPKGARRQLTIAANFYPAKKRLSLHFDSGGHGTHVAGIASGYRIHGQDGYHGVAPGARVISLKIGNNRFAGGSTVTESIKQALDYGVTYAKKHKVPVVYNMSFGVGSELETRSAIDRYVDSLLARNPGVVFVTSAGNEGPGLSTIGTPGAALRSIAVGALLGPKAASAQYGCPLAQETVFSFSSRGGELFKPDIVAPGSAASTVPLWENRDHFHGTSMASPCACGGIALLVDALARDEKKYPIDNALILRAVKMAARDVPTLGVLDEGGGALDIPAAHAYAKALYDSGEHRILRRYRVINRGPAQGYEAVYWRYTPALPRKTDVMQLVLAPEFVKGVSAEAKARFYRAFDLVPDSDWITLTKPMAYLKGPQPTMLGIMVDVEGKAPGLYCGKVQAFRKNSDAKTRVPDFVIPVSVLVPHRTNATNRGRFHAAGKVGPGLFERVFFEVPAGVQAVTLKLRMLEGGKASQLSAALFDPDGMARGGVGPVTESGDHTEAARTISGAHVVPGTWEVVVNSSIRSQAVASWDLGIKLSGVTIGEVIPFAAGAATTRPRVVIPVRCTQPGSFRGTLKARLDRFVKEEVVEVEKSDEFSRVVRLDDTTTTARWTITFDRATYALQTDCVLQVIDLKTGKTIRNTALGNRSESVSVTLPKKAKEPVSYKLTLRPAFTVAKDKQRWSFLLTEELMWSAPAAVFEPIAPKGGQVSLMPNSRQNVVFRLPATLPTAPAGYRLGGTVEAASGGEEGVKITRPLKM